MHNDDQDQDESKIPRTLGIFIAFAVTNVSALFFLQVTESRETSFALRAVVWTGWILGNYAYAQLWIAEGRARERRERADRAHQARPESGEGPSAKS